MCEEWINDYSKFYEWSIKNGASKELTIDRIDNNGNYEPNNCRWVDSIVQANNKTQNRIIEYNGEKHRADVMACGHVIEFQHSPITAEEFNKRNRFYLSYGKKVIWIFDFRNEFENGLMECYDEWHRNKDNGGKFMWKYAKRFLQNYLPQRDKNIIVFFQIAEADYTNKKEAYL
jgi:hypothetical protein